MNLYLTLWCLVTVQATQALLTLRIHKYCCYYSYDCHNVSSVYLKKHMGMAITSEKLSYIYWSVQIVTNNPVLENWQLYRSSSPTPHPPFVVLSGHVLCILNHINHMRPDNQNLLNMCDYAKIITNFFF